MSESKKRSDNSKKIEYNKGLSWTKIRYSNFLDNIDLYIK